MANDQTTPFPINLRPLNIIAHPHPPPTSRPFPDVVSSFFPNHPLPPSLQDLPAAATSPTTTRSTSTYASFFYPPTTVSTDSRFPGGLAQGFPNPSMPVWYPRAPSPPTTTNPLSSAIVAHTPAAAAAASRIGGANISSDYDATPTTTTTTTTTTTPTTTAEESTDDSAKKVKFLCSFGGKILPRPSDGLLRYVGGHTRIISVKRDISFPDLVRKLMDAYGQPVIIKYQLPDEDLDALISVSCPEDLDNMMDEYTKLSSDGSAKLRLFLFSASDLQSSPHATHLHFADFHDSGQRYVDAVNGIPEVVGGVTLTRRGSTASATSTQNSDSLVSGSEGVDTSLVHALHGDGSGQPSSPGVLSPRVAPPTAVDATTRLVYVGPNPVMYAENPSVTMGHTTLIPPPTHTLTSALPEAEVQGPIRAVGQQKPLGYEYHQPSGMNFASTLAYTQAYVDPHQEAFSRVDYPQFSPQIGYPNSQTYGMPGSFYRHVDHPQQIQDNTAGFPPHQFIPTMHTTMASSTSNVNMRPNGAQSFMQQHQAWVNSYPEENSFGTRIVQLPNENIQKAHEFQPQSLQPPIQLQARAYDRFQVPSSEHMVFSDGCDSLQQKAFPERTIRLDDCHMCQKALPHAHSDTLVPDQRDSLTNTIANSNPAFHSLFSENISKVRAMRRIGVSGAMGEGTVEHQATKTQLIDGRMEAVYVNPSEISVNTEQCRLPSNQVRKEAILDGRSQMMGKETYLTNAISKPGVAPGEIHIKPVATLPSASSEVAYLQDLQPIESIRITQPVSLGNSGQYPHPDAAVQQLTSGEMWNSKLTFSGVDSAFATDTIFPTGGQRDEDPQYHSRIVSNDSVSVLPNGESALSPSSGFDEGDRDVAPSNSLFSNQDPWTLRHGTQFPPPRPNKVLASKEAQLSGSLKKDVSLEQEGYIKDSAEEHIKQELQSVAEGVAASVLQSSVPSDVSGVEMSEPIPEDGVEVQNAAEDENVKTKLLDNTIPSLPISDGIGRLQIIKNNDLEELRELGSGTFGTVYHGKWRGTDVAIKRINNRCFAGKPSEQDRMRDDFWNEAIKLADLHHPNVVAFYGVVLDGPGGSVATVTEYMVNGSLRQAIQRNERTLDKRKRIVIAMDVAFGMEYLHGKNIVHFDLKSDNLLVNLRDPHRPICKVGDLGLSKVKCQTLISGGVRGTLPWMAPELLNGSSNLVSEKVDVFSFGIVMWELLTGEEPYADLHYGAIIGGIVSNTLRPTVPESCDSEWGSLMERCWSAEPSDRPNFTEIANQLRAMASSLPSKGQGQTQPSQPQPQR